MVGRRLFLSYARPERGRVETLANDLRRAGCDPFFDEQLTTGEKWWSSLLDEIERCSAFVPVLTQSYIVSTPCRSEAEYAYGLNKPLLPIMIEVVNPNECAQFIAETHCLQYDHADVNTVLDLARALMSCRDCPDLPFEMPTRPPIPLSYTGLTVQALRERLDATDDLNRHEQVVLLDDLKMLTTSSEVSSATIYQLLIAFRERPELTVRIADEIPSLLSAVKEAGGLNELGRTEVPDESLREDQPSEPSSTESVANNGSRPERASSFTADGSGRVERTAIGNADERSAQPSTVPDNTAILKCGNCSTDNRVPADARGYICRGCEAVTEFPTCPKCKKRWRIHTPKGSGGANYTCTGCNTSQYFAVRVSESNITVTCDCGEWNLLANGAKGFTCGACKKRFLFCRCPKCRDARSLGVPERQRSKYVSWKSGCGRTFTLPIANASPLGSVLPTKLLYPVGAEPS